MRFLQAANKKLLPHQRAWIADRSQHRIACKARQIGFSTAIAFEAVCDAVLRNQDALIVSAAEKNAQEVLNKCRRWMQLLAIAGIRVELRKDSESEIEITGGHKILSLPQNPATIRGFTGNVYLDEFAHHRDDAAVLEAIGPATTLGYRLSIISTPFGQSGEYYRIWSDEQRYPDFARHRVTIYDAVTAGLRIDVESIRRMYDDESFRQEYLCEFVDESTAYYPYELIRRCIYDKRPNVDGAERYIGIDVGRKNDRTVCAVVARARDELIVEAQEVLSAQTFEAQRAVIGQMIDTHAISGGMIDATGIGMQLAEEISGKYAGIEAVTFTAPLKEQIAVTLKRLFEQGKLLIPADDDLIHDIHSIKRTVTPSNNFRFDAERNEGGHADRFWALGLAVYASEAVSQPNIRLI